MSEGIIDLRAVSRTYVGQPPFHALREVNLTVKAGEAVAIVGPSGSGKTTLLHILGSLDRPSSGRVWIAGQDTSRLSDSELAGLRAHTIGYVFQQFFLLDALSAADNVAMGLLYLGVLPGERRRRAVAALDRVGLGGRASQPVGQLSGGERQRVAVARAIVREPAIILADEPTGNLDTTNGAAVLDLLASLHADGSTVIVITHDLAIASTLPRQVKMRDGSIINDSGLSA